MSEPCEYCGCDPCDCDWGMNSNEEEDAEKKEKQTYKITRCHREDSGTACKASCSRGQ